MYKVKYFIMQPILAHSVPTAIKNPKSLVNEILPQNHKTV